MFFNKNKKNKTSKRRVEDQADTIKTIIAQDIRIKGTLTESSGMRISGFLEGSIDSKGLVWVDKNGKISGPIKARWVIAEGEINGDIESSEKTELRSGCRVTGNIACKKIALAEDSFFQGEIQMTSPKDRPLSFVKKRKTD